MSRVWSLLSVVIFLLPHFALSQTGPGGIGLRDGSSTLELWLDIDKGISTVDHSASGGSANDVSNWADQSGNGLNMVGPGSKDPEFVSGLINSHGAVQFVQSNFERLNLNNTISSIGTSDNRTFLYVFRFTANLNNCEIMGTSTGTSVDYGSFTVTNDRLRLRNLTSNAYSAVNSVTQSVWHVGVIAKNGTSVNAWNDDKNIINTTGDHLDWAVTSGFSIGSANYSGRSFQGEVAELILYSEAINSAKRIIIENYLAAKYGLTLSTYDVYDEDNAGSDFDYEVAGIGRVDASNIHNDAQGTSILRILNPTDLGNDEFFIWGHNNGTLQANNTTDVPSGVTARFGRVWRVSEVSSSGTAVDVGSVDLQFDLSNLGTVVTTDLKLLVDTNNDGLFADETPITGAISLGSNIYAFTGVSAIGNNMRFTLATGNSVQTPLPVELTSLNVYTADNDVVVQWATASERNNDFFTVERSADGTAFEEVASIAGAQNSNVKHNYTLTDYEPFTGLSYYRLKQTDLDGKTEFLGLRSVTVEKTATQAYPNPLTGTELFVPVQSVSSSYLVTISTISGEELYRGYYADANERGVLAVHLSQRPVPGIYLLQVYTSNSVYRQKLIVE